MNKKLIEQLKLQADNWAKDNYTWTPDGTNWYDVYTAKLTELIVRECADVVYSRSGHATPQDLYERFGVEE